jgi:hypothetical protein
MKKLILLLTFVIPIISCSSDEYTIIGTWILVDSREEYYKDGELIRWNLEDEKDIGGKIVFEEYGRGYEYDIHAEKNKSFIWDVKDGKLYISYENHIDYADDYFNIDYINKEEMKVSNPRNYNYNSDFDTKIFSLKFKRVK